MAIEGIKDFLAISPCLVTAGQPTEQQLRELAVQGFEGVINLGLLDPRYCLEDEAGLVQALGLAYLHIPVQFQTPQAADFAQFLAAMDGFEGRKVLVHCAANRRASCFVALYGQARLAWTAPEADALIEQIWQPDRVWAELIETVRQNLFRLTK